MTEDNRARSQLLSRSPDDEEINLFDILIVLAKHKKLVLGLPVTVAILVASISLFLPNTYIGTAKLLPPQQQSSASALLGQLGALGILAGSSVGLKNPADLYVGMLQSRTVADKLIERFKLQELYERDTLVETRKTLEGLSDIKAGKDGIVTVSVEDKDPKRAAALANAYVEELDKLAESLAVTEAGQRRLFFERQLKATKEDLARAEADLRKTQELSGLIQPEEQAKAIIGAIATLQARIVAQEGELASRSQFSTPQNPEYLRAQKQLASLRKELVDMQRKHHVRSEGGIFVPTGNIPEAGLDYIRKLRDVKYHETLFEVLAKQLELAKIDEAKDSAVMQVIDRAVEPDRKSKPKRALITLVSASIAFLVGILLAFVLEARERASKDPGQAERFAELRRHLRLK